MKARSSELLQQMRDHAGHALAFVAGMRQQDFLKDRRTQQAVSMSLVVIGEAAARLIERHPDVVARYPTIPWDNIRAMRNRLTHGYLAIDQNVVWDTVQYALPNLLSTLDNRS